MKNFIFAAGLLLALPMFGQNDIPEPNQVSPHVSTTVSYAKIVVGAKSGQSTDVSVFEASIPFTKRWSVGVDVLTFGPDGRAIIPGGEISDRLGHIFHPKGALIDFNKIEISAKFGAGVKQDAGVTSFSLNSGGNTPVFGVGGCVKIDAGTLFSGQLKMGACVGGLFMPWNPSGQTRIGLTSSMNLQPLLSWSK